MSTPRRMSMGGMRSVILRKSETNSNQFKSTKTLYMGLISLILGGYQLHTFPQHMIQHESKLETVIPIIVSTTFVSIPLTFVALGMSQYSRRGPIKIWDASPVWRGIGIAGTCCLYVSMMQNLILGAYFLFYAVHTVFYDTPWLKCDKNQTFEKEMCYTFKEVRSIQIDCYEAFDEAHCKAIPRVHSAQWFWNFAAVVNQEVSNWENFRPHLLPYGAAISVWLFICIRHSERSFEVFVNFLVIFPTVLQVAVFVRSFLHPGIINSLEYLTEFKIKNLFILDNWITYLVYNLNALNICFGGLAPLGKQQHFRSPTNAVAIFLNISLILYSVFYGVLVYNIQGTLCYELNRPMKNISDMGLFQNFIQCPLGLAYWGMTKLWTFLFYLSNFLITFRQLSMQSIVLLSVLYEMKPKLYHYTLYCSMIFCIFNLFLMIVFSFQTLHLLLYYVNFFIRDLVVPPLAFFFSVFLVFFYGVQHFVDDMHFMLGIRTMTIWKLSWYMGVVIFTTAILDTYSHYFEKLRSSELADIKFIILAGVALVAMFPLFYLIVTVLITWRTKGSIIATFKPLKDWGPEEEILRKSRDMFSAHDMTKEYLYRQQRLKFKPTNFSHR